MNFVFLISGAIDSLSFNMGNSFQLWRRLWTAVNRVQTLILGGVASQSKRISLSSLLVNRRRLDSSIIEAHEANLGPPTILINAKILSK